MGRLWARVVIFWLFVGWVGMGINFTLYRVGVLLSRLQVGVEVVISGVSTPALYRGVVTLAMLQVGIRLQAGVVILWLFVGWVGMVIGCNGWTWGWVGSWVDFLAQIFSLNLAH